ncbi:MULTISPECIES: DUF3325 domain-containing protein [Tistrella]|uniref:DUF3325 domain-containing protein n=1 Tax=Tistrella TaxID=171436 RepID=UPI003556AEB4
MPPRVQVMTATLLSMAAAWAGLAAISLAMDRHHRQVFDRSPSRLRVGTLKAMGWVLLAISAGVIIDGRGLGIGLAGWICIVPMAGLVLAGGLAIIAPRVSRRISARAPRAADARSTTRSAAPPPPSAPAMPPPTAGPAHRH